MVSKNLNFLFVPASFAKIETKANIPNAATWYIADKEMGYPDQATAHLSESTVLYSTSRFHILNELNNSSSNQAQKISLILGLFN